MGGGKGREGGRREREGTKEERAREEDNRTEKININKGILTFPTVETT